MAKSTASKIKKRMGRPPTGLPRGIGVYVKIPPKELAAIDAWISKQPDPKPTRPQAIRRLVEKSIADESKIKR
jgi:hypothetical protein